MVVEHKLREDATGFGHSRMQYTRSELPAFTHRPCEWPRIQPRVQRGAALAWMRYIKLGSAKRGVPGGSRTPSSYKKISLLLTIPPNISRLTVWLSLVRPTQDRPKSWSSRLMSGRPTAESPTRSLIRGWFRRSNPSEGSSQ